MVTEIFQKPKPVIGTMRMLPLHTPEGAPIGRDDILLRAEQEALALASGGVDAILLEVWPEQVTHKNDAAAFSLISVVLQRLQRLVSFPVGLAMMPNQPEAALHIAYSAGASFIRVPVAIGAWLCESGWQNAAYAALYQVWSALPFSSQPIALLLDVGPEHQLPESLLSNSESAIPDECVAIRGMVQWLSGLPKAQRTPVEALVLRGWPNLDLEMMTAIQNECPVPVWVDDTASVDLLPSCYMTAMGVILHQSMTRPPMPGGNVNQPVVDMMRVEQWVQALGRLPLAH